MKQHIIIVSVLILMSLVSADIRVVLNNPQIVFTNITGSNFQYHLGVENKNNYTTQIVIMPPDNLNLTFDSPLTFELLPNESRKINYTGTILKYGNYTEQILVKFSGNNETFTWSSNLIFIVTISDESQTENLSIINKTKVTNTSENTISPIFTFLINLLVVLIIIAIVYIIIRIIKNKNKEKDL